MDKPSESGDPAEENKSEEKDEKPLEQEAENKQEEAQKLIVKFVDDYVPKEEESMLQKRKHFESELT